MARKIETPIVLTPEIREQLRAVARSRTLEYRRVVRAKALLWSADGQTDVEIANRTEVSVKTVAAWRDDFQRRGLECLADKKRPGRRGSFSP